MEWHPSGIWTVGLGTFADAGSLSVMDGSCVIGFSIRFKNPLPNTSVVD